MSLTPYFIEPTPAGPGGAADGVTATETGGLNAFHKTVLACAGLPIVITDEAGQGQYGGAATAIYTFPAGLICVFGATIDGALTLGTTGTITDNYEGNIALGVAAPSSAAAMTSTSLAKILNSTALTTADAKIATADAVSIATALTEAGARWIDGSGTPVPMFLNLVIADEATHTSGTGYFDGTITFMWVNLGDVTP